MRPDNPEPAGFPGHQHRHAPTPGMQAERRNATVMFADIAGFTSLAETMDPEKVRDLVNACFEKLVPAVDRYGGRVDKFIGDEIMAVFGAPTAHDNDPERALRTALEMQRALVDFNASRAVELGIHFGINSGLVVAGGIGTSDQHSYSVLGDAVNLAARLRDAAQRNEILVGPDTYRATSHIFDFHAVGPLRVKGKDEPVLAYKLLSIRPQPGMPGRLESRGISSPLVGRDSEIGVFTDCIERLLAGQGGLVSIVGEAGLGKSRLVAEVRGHARERELSWLEGRALSFSQTISYWPFLEVILADAGITPDDSEGERWAKLHRRVSTLFSEETPEILPYLASLLALEVPEGMSERVRYLDGEAMGHQVFRVMRRFFVRLARERPVVLVFEDMHWIDDSSASLVEHLLPLVREVPLLVCGISRPDAATPVARLRQVAEHDFADCFREIVLAPLSATESADLIHNLLGTSEVAPGLRDALLRKAEGNPFFVEEVIRALIDLGGLARDKATGGWRVTAQVEEIAIPDTLQGVIMARIDRLDEEMKQVLKLASVIGRSFLYRVLRALAEAERQLDRNLDELQNAELIREKRRLPELEYIFKHALVQETTYESILLQLRRELHRRVGECIEALFAGRLEEFYALLSYHYSRAEDWTKAQEYLFKAGDQAGKIAADAEALAHYQQAMAAYARAFGNRWDPIERAVLERKMGEALFRRGEHVQAREYLLRALSSLGSPYPTSRSGVRLAIARQLVRQIANRILSNRLSRQVPDRASGVSEERCRIYWELEWVDYFVDLERTVLDTLLHSNVAEHSGLQVDVVLGLMALGTVCNAIPLHRLARYYYARAVALADEVQQPLALGQAYLGLALFEHHNLGKWESAQANYRLAYAAYWEAGHLRRWAAASGLAALLFALQGELAASLKLSREIVHVGQDAADPIAWGYGLMVLGNGLARRGASDEAVSSLRQAIELFERAPDYQCTVFAAGSLARCLLERGDLEQALVLLEESEQIIARRGLRGFFGVPVWTSLAQARLTEAEQAKESAKATALKNAKQACRIALKHSRFDRGALPVVYRMLGTYEWLSGRAAAAQRWWRQSVQIAEDLGARHELATTHREIGRRIGDSSHLERAETILADMYAKSQQNQTPKLT